MALTVGTSYVTMAEAAGFMARRLRTEAWDTAPDFVREKSLKHAALLLDGLPWAGDKTDEDQALAFPRDGSEEVPQAIKDAQTELALTLLDEDVSHVLTTKGTKFLTGEGTEPLHEGQAFEAAQRFRRETGAGGKVLVLGEHEEYQAYGRKNCLARFGGSFHDLPTVVQNLLGEHVALGARLTR
jgi:DnaT-like ssDNA binding protein